MGKLRIDPVIKMHGTVTVPGDKSISHRTVMLGAISEGITEAEGFLPGEDCLSTIRCFRQMGIEITQEDTRVIIHGKGLHGLSAPGGMLDVGNSGTTMRLMSGILAGQPFQSMLDGDESIRKRPMGRVITPLREMGAAIEGTGEKMTAPLTVEGQRLHGISYTSPVASAQVKSCVLLAGLYAEGTTTVTEPTRSRDHTERMLTAFGADLLVDGNSVSVQPEPKLSGQKLQVPGDISSAAYFIAAGLLVPGAEILIKNVGINPTRDGILQVACAMGGNVELISEREVSGEPVADLLVKSSLLHGTEVSGHMIPTLIDEIPVIAVMAACAEGTTVIRDAAELRVKETDRIATVTENLQVLGIQAEAMPDGMVIHGGQFAGGTVNSFLDHRIAMAFAVAGLIAKSPVTIRDAECVNISYPSFFSDLNALQK
ncbi:MAG: 3-phosphoshikimate 1-carboxyvinyltransferase [Lachnospiraceae bacterium]|nr:3-phosphoshikimate 1-carboxyvinyltransferase [Lachnospiraceae bacterium]